MYMSVCACKLLNPELPADRHIPTEILHSAVHTQAGRPVVAAGLSQPADLTD